MRYLRFAASASPARRARCFASARARSRRGVAGGESREPRRASRRPPRRRPSRALSSASRDEQEEVGRGLRERGFEIPRAPLRRPSGPRSRSEAGGRPARREVLRGGGRGLLVGLGSAPAGSPASSRRAPSSARTRASPGREPQRLGQEPLGRRRDPWRASRRRRRSPSRADPRARDGAPPRTAGRPRRRSSLSSAASPTLRADWSFAGRRARAPAAKLRESGDQEEHQRRHRDPAGSEAELRPHSPRAPSGTPVNVGSSKRQKTIFCTYSAVGGEGLRRRDRDLGGALQRESRRLPAEIAGSATERRADVLGPARAPGAPRTRAASPRRSCRPSRPGRPRGSPTWRGSFPAGVTTACPTAQVPIRSHSSWIVGPPRCADRAGDARAQLQRLVGGVDDGVDAEPRDVRLA